MNSLRLRRFLTPVGASIDLSLQGDCMIELSRAAAGRFRAAARRCVVGRPRGPAPPVLVTQTPHALSLFCDWGEVALALALPGATGTSSALTVPGSLLDEIESAKGGTAT